MHTALRVVSGGKGVSIQRTGRDEEEGELEVRTAAEGAVP